jgi:hypothetical protein
LKHHHRASLLCLNGRHAPCLAEWSAAYFYVKQHGAKIEWKNVNAGGPEFIAHTDNASFEVECKRYGSMLAEKLGDNESNALATEVLSLLKECGVYGVLDVTARTHPGVQAGEALRVLRELIAAAQFPVEVSVDEGPLQISGTILKVSANADFSTGFEELERLPPDVRSYGTASDAGGRPANLRLLRVKGPRRTPNEMRDNLLEKMERAVQEQLTGAMGGVLVLEFARVDDPTAFRDSPGVQDVLRLLFDNHRHLSVIVLRAAPFARDHEGYVQMNQFAYVAKSAVTAFPEVAALSHIQEDKEPTAV